MESVDLNAKASQTAFARLVGISQQAVSKQIEKGNLTEDGSFGEWLLQYCDQLREQASGRGGEGQVDVARATYDEKVVKTALGRLDYQEKLGNTIHKEEAYQLLASWVAVAVRHFREAFDRLGRDVSDQLDVSLPDELVEKYAGAAIERVKGHVLELEGSSGQSGGTSDSAEEARH